MENYGIDVMYLSRVKHQTLSPFTLQSKYKYTISDCFSSIVMFKQLNSGNFESWRVDGDVLLRVTRIFLLCRWKPYKIGQVG